jgi:hypothetical protein
MHGRSCQGGDRLILSVLYLGHLEKTIMRANPGPDSNHRRTKGSDPVFTWNSFDGPAVGQFSMI